MSALNKSLIEAREIFLVLSPAGFLSSVHIFLVPACKWFSCVLSPAGFLSPAHIFLVPAWKWFSWDFYESNVPTHLGFIYQYQFIHLVDAKSVILVIASCLIY